MAKNKKTKIQTLIFSKRYYPTKRRVKEWIMAHPEFKMLKYKRNPIDDNPETYRVRQREPYYFNKSTFRTININKSGTIKAVVGKLR